MAGITSLDIFNREKPTILETGTKFLERATATIPPGKNKVLIVGADFDGWRPVVRFGVAARVGDTFQLGAEAQRKFERHGTSGTVWAAWSWK